MCNGGDLKSSRSIRTPESHGRFIRKQTINRNYIYKMRQVKFVPNKFSTATFHRDGEKYDSGILTGDVQIG